MKNKDNPEQKPLRRTVEDYLKELPTYFRSLIINSFPSSYRLYKDVYVWGLSDAIAEIHWDDDIDYHGIKISSSLVYNDIGARFDESDLNHDLRNHNINGNRQLAYYLRQLPDDLYVDALHLCSYKKINIYNRWFAGAAAAISSITWYSPLADDPRWRIVETGLRDSVSNHYAKKFGKT